MALSPPHTRRTRDVDATDDTHDPVDERVGVARSVSLGFQHVLVMYAGVIAVPLIFAQTMGLTASQTITLLNINLIVGGIGTLIQTLGLWKFGARFPLVQGASFIGLAPSLLIGQDYGLRYVFGSVIAAGLIVLVAAPLLGQVLRLFPPVVIGSVITIVGLSLMPAAAGWFGGGADSPDFGSAENLALGAGTVVLIVALYAFTRGAWRNLSILVALVVGTVIALSAGMTDFGDVGSASWAGISNPFELGAPAFSPIPILVMTLAMFVIVAETTGNMLAIGRMASTEVTPQRLASAFRGDGLSTAIGGLFHGFPLNAFSQNSGLIAMTGVRSRFVVATGGVLMILMGLVPKLGAVVAAIPPSVLGGAAIVMFGMTTAAGIQELARVRYEGTNNSLVVAVAVSVGVLPMAAPTLFEKFDGTLGMVLSSGILLGTVAAVVLNLVCNLRRTPAGRDAASTSHSATEDLEVVR
ncbi:nucleobase:cation symporter-2 family protein [Gordonia insulae]|nr:nucleobase:cation symporter-2 family protein [Gordonia insulae]